MRESAAMRNGTANTAICLLVLLLTGGCRKLEVPKEATDALREVTTGMFHESLNELFDLQSDRLAAMENQGLIKVSQASMIRLQSSLRQE